MNTKHIFLAAARAYREAAPDAAYKAAYDAAYPLARAAYTNDPQPYISLDGGADSLAASAANAIHYTCNRQNHTNKGDTK